MSHTLKSILTDYEFWLILAGAIGAAANAEGKLELLSFSMLWIAAMFGLVSAYIWRKYEALKASHTPFVVVVGKPKDEYRDMLNEVEQTLVHHKIAAAPIEKRFRLHREDWIYYHEKTLSARRNEWHSILVEIGEKFWSLAARISGRKVYHLIMNCPPSLALALGATIGSRNAFVFYHYMASANDDPYHKLIDFKDIPEGTHRLKTRVADFQHVQSVGLETIPASPTEVLVAINLAGHSPIGDVASRSQSTGFPMIAIQPKYSGTIPLDADWVRLAQEVATILLNLAAHESVRRMHLFLSAPLPVAFCLGAALGKFVRATVYNAYGHAGEYFEVFRLEEL